MADDISSEVIKKTQKLLGKYVKKPALTEKLLKKPPFRFLHDIVVAIIKDTGFLKGLYSAEELLSENIKHKEAKVAFLNKLIDAIKTTTKADLTVRASKIVAGLEPTKTNLLLQAIGKALDDKIDTSTYIAQLNSGQKDTTEKKKLKKSTPIKDDKGRTSKSKNKDDSNSKTTSRTKKISESPRSNTKASTPKQDSSRAGSKIKKTSKNDPIKQASIEEETRSETNKKETVTEATAKENAPTTSAITDVGQIKVAENQNNTSDGHIKVDDQNSVEHVKVKENLPSLSKDSNNLEIITKEQDTRSVNVDTKKIKNDAQNTQNLARPKSARPKKLNTDENEILKPLQMTAAQVQRPKSSLRPPSVRPSSARPGAPRLRPDSALPLQENVMMGNINVIIENVDNVDDEETVVIQTTSDVVEENFNPSDVPMDNKGQLVEQILEQIQGEDKDGVKKKVDIDWEQDALHNKDGTMREINQLRSLIQTLTKTANPLGKLLNYLHEDIEAMYAELQMWRNMKHQLYSEIYKQQRISSDSNKHLETQLEHIDNEIIRHRSIIFVVRSNVIRNEIRIKELLTG